MFRYILKRLLALIPVLIGVSFFIFSLLALTPGDPANIVLGADADEAAIKIFRTEQGLDDPFLVRYARFVYRAVAHGDIGRSYATHRPVAAEIVTVFPTTVKLASLAVLTAVVIGIPFGIISAVKQYSVLDSVTMILAMVGVSMPNFWIGVLLILFFSVHLGWFPSSGFDTLSAMILPSVTLASNTLAIITRMTRSSMLEVIKSDYIRTARAKGQRESVVIWKHALGNALIPIITVVGIQFGHLLGGAILTESIFSVPGLGRLMVDGIKSRDYPVVQGGVLYIALMFALINLLVDLLYAWVDPRIRMRYR
ncbi:MAG: ABC transporter permease [Synergistaceae bacterium]|nr:ABC transporter permease [Synergistaceae bacterium]